MTGNVTALRARGVRVPMKRPLHTGGGAVTDAPLALVDLDTDAGVSGCAYLFCYTPLALNAVVTLCNDLAAVLVGEPAAPRHLAGLIATRFRLVGPQGLTGLVRSGIDMAAWDAEARTQQRPLAELLGAASGCQLPAYNSNGLGLREDRQALAREAVELAEGGFGAIKLRLGYADPGADHAAWRAVREAVGDGVAIMSDYNQCLSVPEAQRRARALEQTDLYWIEEPVRADDHAGAAAVRAVSRIPIQLGENDWGPEDAHRALQAGAADYYMPDAGKIGGVTGWLEATALARAHGVPVSSHLYPEISVHLLAATPGAHWLEYVDWAAPILREPLAVVDGIAAVPQRPGHGMAWNEDTVASLLI
jgi:mandelate racemase